MNLEEQKVYIEQVATLIIKKILSMKNINPEKIDKEHLISVATQAAKDLLTINYKNYGEFALFDEFTAMQLENNCRVGELQAFFDEYVGTKINISRYGKEDLSDLTIKLTNEYEDITTTVIEEKDGKTIQITNGEGKELRFQDKKIRILDKDGMHEFLDTHSISLEQAMDLFQTNINHTEIERMMIEEGKEDTTKDEKNTTK